MDRFHTIISDKQDYIDLLTWLEENTTVKWISNDLPASEPHFLERAIRSKTLGYHMYDKGITHSSNKKMPLISNQEFKNRIQKLFPKEEITGPIAVKIEGNKYKEILEWLENNTSILWVGKNEKPTEYLIPGNCNALNLDLDISSRGLSYCSGSILRKEVDLSTFKSEAKRRYPKEKAETSSPQPDKKYLGIWENPDGTHYYIDHSKNGYFAYTPAMVETIGEVMELENPGLFITNLELTRPKPYKPGDCRNRILPRPEAKSYLSQGKSGWSSY